MQVVLLYRRAKYGYAFRRIPLTQGYFAIIDPCDYEQLSRCKWRLCKTKGKNVLYAERSVRKADGKYSRILMHREILSLSKGEVIQPPDGYVIDHMNGFGLDNRRANLRLATVAQNAWNAQKRGGRSGYKGVWLAKDKGLWRAAIVCHGKRKHLGYFHDKCEAAKAYDRAAREYHGPFAAPNFPKAREPVDSPFVYKEPLLNCR
ncbi:MAG: HNH endonuclease [Sedimentisphaerales bacterium]|nr:HNH endonuclease [Sedimentisphaerales bacterium]